MNIMKILLLCVILVSLSQCQGRQCSQGCMNCTTDYNCVTCSTGTFLKQGKCIQCPYLCNTCDNNGICSVCQQGILTDGKCLICSKNCQNSTTCTNIPTNCTSCLSPLVLSSQQCILSVSCPIYNCITCAQTYTNSSTLSCSSCTNKYFAWKNYCNLCPFPIKQCKLQDTTLTNTNVNNFVTYHFNAVYPSGTVPDITAFSHWQKQNIFQMFIIQQIINSTVSGLSSNITNILQNIGVIANSTINPIKLTDDNKNVLFGLTTAYAAYNANQINQKILNQIRSVTYLTVDSCSDGFYGALCGKCLSGCKTCNGNSTCIQCFNGYQLNGNTCQIPTPPCKSTSSVNTTCLSCYLPYYLNSTNQCILCTASNCQTCSDTGTQCITCLQQYSRLPNINTGLCYRCNQFYCYHCNAGNISQCIQCKIGYVLATNNSCVACSNNCEACIPDSNNTGQYICMKCMESYTLINGVCTVCGNGCLICSSFNNKVCFKCSYGLYINSNSICVGCPNYCQQCTNIDGICTKYKSGYSVYNNITLYCMIGCKICSNINNNNYKCLQCNPGNYLNANNVCLKCAVRCLSCTSATTCSKCLANTHLYNNTCLICQGNCLSCLADLVTCQSCIRGYVLDQVTKRCNIICGRGCLECSITGQKCQICKNGFSLNEAGKCIRCLVGCSGRCNSNNIIQCYNCNYGYQTIITTALTSSNRINCLKCPTGCQTCINSVCTSCFTGYQLTSDSNGFICKSFCNFPCKTCDATGCLECQTGYIITSSSGGYCVFDPNSCSPKCQICPAGSFKDNSGSCSQCPTNGCSSCQYLTGTCQACFDGFYYNLTSCVPCINNCRICISDNTCLKCGIGYTNSILTINNNPFSATYSPKCLACSSKCLSCSISIDLCQSCADQYRLRDSQCFGRNNVGFKFKFNKDFGEFLIDGQSETIIGNIAKILAIDSNNIILTNLSNGSTIVSGSVSANNDTQAIYLANLLYDTVQGNKDILGFTATQSYVGAYYDDTQIYDSAKFRSVPTVIIGVSIAVGCLVIIILLIFCITNRLQDKKQTYSLTASQKQIRETQYQKRLAEENYAVNSVSSVNPIQISNTKIDEFTLNQLYNLN